MSIKTPRHGNRKYPWEKWANLKPHTIESGVHFIDTAERFRRQLAAYAAKNSLKVKTRVKGESIWFCFSLPTTG